MEHWLKKIFEKFTPKHVQNNFRHFWERFWAFLEFWKLFKNISKTRPSVDMEHWAKKFLEKITPKKISRKHVQNTFGQFGNNFGRFWNLENFLNLYKDIS